MKDSISILIDKIIQKEKDLEILEERERLIKQSDLLNNKADINQKENEAVLNKNEENNENENDEGKLK